MVQIQRRKIYKTFTMTHYKLLRKARCRRSSSSVIIKQLGMTGGNSEGSLGLKETTHQSCPNSSAKHPHLPRISVSEHSVIYQQTEQVNSHKPFNSSTNYQISHQPTTILYAGQQRLLFNIASRRRACCLGAGCGLGDRPGVGSLTWPAERAATSDGASWCRQRRQLSGKTERC